MNVFESLLDVPLDDPGIDGDDRLVPKEMGIVHAPTEPLMLLAHMGLENVVVPFRGPFRVKVPPMRSPAIRALKRAGSRAGRIPWREFDNTYWPRTAKWIRLFQEDSHIPVTGIYDYATHRKLSPFYDPYSIEVLLDEPTLTPEQKKRNAMLARFMYLYSNRWRYPYTQRRAWDTRYDPVWGIDCSGGFASGCKFGGVPEPSGYSSWGWGNTDTQLAHLSHLGRRLASIRDARVGDPKFYGWGGDPSHVAVFIGRKDGVSRVWSFGSYPIKILDADYRHDGIVACSVLPR